LLAGPSSAIGSLLDPGGILAGSYDGPIIKRYSFDGDEEATLTITGGPSAIKGIAVVSDRLFIVHHSPETVYEVNPDTGHVIARFSVDDEMNYPESLGDNGVNLLVVDRNANPDVLHEYSLDGVHVGSLTLNYSSSSGNMNTNGVDSDGSCVFTADNMLNRLVEYDAGGNVVMDIALPTIPNHSHIGYSLGYDWMSDNIFVGFSDGQIARYSRSGSLLSTFQSAFKVGGLEITGVPEPATLSLLVMCIPLVIGRRRTARLVRHNQ